MSKEAAERDPELRTHWLYKLGFWKAEQLVFIDESGFNFKTGQPTHGYARKGERARVPLSARRGEKLSLLPAMSVEGIFACSIYRGAVDANNFEKFIGERVLESCEPYPRKGP